MTPPDLTVSPIETPNSPELLELLDFALELTALADAQILPLFGRCTASLKPDGTEVTEADRRAEEALRARLAAACPDHSVLGEELGESGGAGARWRWLLDPIDGTASFTLGLPTFGTLIALLDGDEPVLGVIHLPALGESVAAARGAGCWRVRRGETTRERLAVRPVAELNSAVASATGVYHSDISPPARGAAVQLSAVIRRARKFRFVGDCLQYALLCRGVLDVAIDQVMHPWDTAALVPCVEEAGGTITDLRGERRGIVFAGSAMASSDPRLQAEVLALLGGQPVRNG